MRRLLLRAAAVFSVPLIGLTIAMWSRSQHAMDWLRVRGFDHAAVLASSRASIGAAILTGDSPEWTTSRQPVRYKKFPAMDLGRQFDSTALGFAAREDHGVYFLLLPMWSLLLLGILPPALLVVTKQIKSNDSPIAPSIS